MDIINPQSAQIVGGFLISAAYIPQILRMYKTKSSWDVSLGFLWLIILALVLMLIYSLDLFIDHGVGLPLLITNLLNLLMVFLTLFVAYRFRKKK